MVEPGSEVMEFPALVVTFIVGATILVIVYISSLFKSQKEDNKKRQTTENVTKEKSHQQSGQHNQHHHHSDSNTTSNTGGGNKKKQQAQKWRPENTKQNFTHPWLVTSFKGHGGAVHDMDFSPNGKLLASCAEDDGSSGTSSGSEGNKENNPVISTTGLSRRQKKNRVRRDDGVLGNSVKKKSNHSNNNANNNSTNNSSNNNNNNNNNNKSKYYCGLFKQHYHFLGISDLLLIQYLQHYLIRIDQLFWLGYPVESTNHPGRAIIFKQSGEFVFSLTSLNNLFTSPSTITSFTTSAPTTPLISSTKGFDINAREFIPKDNTKYSCNNNNYYYDYNYNFNNMNNYTNNYCNLYDSHVISSNIEIHCDLKKKSSNKEDKLDYSTVYHQQKKCMRCSKLFSMSSKGEYVTREQCLYHWGRLKRQFHEPDLSIYSCCQGKKESKGCTTAKLHVWSGLEEDIINGPLDGFVRTRPRKTPPPDGSNGLYAIDCEMCFTSKGLELAKVTVIGYDGRIVYDTLVKPENEIVDYNTRFSGITAKDMNKKSNYKSLKDVQNDLMGFINADTILLGHGMENDLRALKMIHTNCVDTAVVFPHYYGFPYRRSLKSLVECFLKKSIQNDATGHDSIEDAISCLELMLWKVKSDLGSVNLSLSSNHLPINTNRL